jgi:hypothetical protein
MRYPRKRSSYGQNNEHRLAGDTDQSQPNCKRALSHETEEEREGGLRRAWALRRRRRSRCAAMRRLSANIPMVAAATTLSLLAPDLSVCQPASILFYSINLSTLVRIGSTTTPNAREGMKSPESPRHEETWQRRAKRKMRKKGATNRRLDIWAAAMQGPREKKKAFRKLAKLCLPRHRLIRLRLTGTASTPPHSGCTTTTPATARRHPRQLRLPQPPRDHLPRAATNTRRCERENGSMR